MLIRDIEIEMMISNKARVYIGKKVLKKNIFFPESLPLFAIESKHSKES